MTYSLDPNLLEQQAQQLAEVNNKIVQDADEIQTILSQIQANWQNNYEGDLKSVVTALTTCINNLKNAITPTVAKYSSTMNTLVVQTRATQSKTVQ